MLCIMNPRQGRECIYREVDIQKNEEFTGVTVNIGSLKGINAQK